MRVTIGLPADVSAKLQEQGTELSRRALEALAAHRELGLLPG